MLPRFLNLKRLQQFKNNVIGNTAYLGQFLICNTPLVYTIYNKTFNLQIFIFSYVGCGILQGFINSILYYVSDIYFFGKRIDESRIPPPSKGGFYKRAWSQSGRWIPARMEPLEIAFQVRGLVRQGTGDRTGMAEDSAGREWCPVCVPYC